MEVPIDIADALREWLTDEGHSCSATPLPDTFEDSLPFTLFRAVGGSRTWPVIDRHNVGIDVYADTMAEAIAEARTVYAMLDNLNATSPKLGGVQLYRVELGSAPQEATDPAHPSVPMATFLAVVSTRAQHLD